MRMQQTRLERLSKETERNSRNMNELGGSRPKYQYPGRTIQSGEQTDGTGQTDRLTTSDSPSHSNVGYIGMHAQLVVRSFCKT